MTAQQVDVLHLEELTFSLCTLPLSLLFDTFNPTPKLVVESSNNWRGYIATWKILNDRLYLINFEGELLYSMPQYKRKELKSKIAPKYQNKIKLLEKMRKNSDGEILPNKKWEESYVPVDNGSIDTSLNISIEEIFESHVNPVFASWYSGLLQCKYGKDLWRSNAGFHFKTEKELLLHIERGAVVKSWIIDNIPRHGNVVFNDGEYFG